MYVRKAMYIRHTHWYDPRLVSMINPHANYCSTREYSSKFQPAVGASDNVKMYTRYFTLYAGTS